jgi:ribonucleotide reductase alpha subunit
MSTTISIMHVKKRNGNYEEVSFDKVIYRIKALCQQHPPCNQVEYIAVAQKVISKIYDGVSTTELDELAANTCISMSTDEPEYGTIASRILVSNNHKNTPDSFHAAMSQLYHFETNGQHTPVVSQEVYELSKNPAIESKIDYSRDFYFDYFGFKTLEKGYLKKLTECSVERPQHLWMRVALGIHGANLDAAFETYDALSQKQITHATPTLFHSGTPSSQFLSCFLLGMDDSIDGIYKCISDCARISKWAGGIGVNVSKIRSRGASIRGTNGQSHGIIPMLKVFNDTALYVNQSGKRNGSFAMYLETWHPDIIDFLDLKKNHGDESARCRDLFYAVWISDLFMQRVESGAMWSLMDPDECPGLPEAYGEAFNQLYEQYEKQGRFRKQIPAQDIFNKIIESQIETGTPYIGYKDAVNRKSNQKNIGTIMNSNLCHEICEYSDSKEYACCTLGSLGLPAFLTWTDDRKSCSFDFNGLAQSVRILVRNLNIIIDKNFYPVPETRASNFRHRPIGIGVQGLADVFMQLRMSFESAEAACLNKEIFATIYYIALCESVELSKQKTAEYKDKSAASNPWEAEAVETRLKAGNSYLGAYSSFEGSPISQGIFQFDMWGVIPLASAGPIAFDWEKLRSEIQTFGIRNSLLVAPMPTASTSQILGNTECFEPITSNIYVRRVLAGDYIVVNQFLIEDLKQLGLWNKKMKDRIIVNNGSVQTIASIPLNIRNLYKTSWDISMRTIIDMAADRGAYICQTQSMNLFMSKPEFSKIRGMHMYAWKKGLKTGMYYLRTMAVAKAQQITIDPTITQVNTTTENEENFCSRNNPNCLACSS